MTAKKIYIIRHGQTQFNKLGLVQGSGIDSELNELGLRQAQAFADYFQDVPFDKVYTSKLKRTHQSVGPFIEKGLPWQQLEGLNEISWGKKEGRIITSQDDLKYYEMIDAWRNGIIDFKTEGGESPLDVSLRQQLAWKYIMAHDQERNILVCMHGRAIRILLCQLTGEPLSHMEQFPHENLGLYLLSFQNGQYTIELTNFTHHLEINGLMMAKEKLSAS